MDRLIEQKRGIKRKHIPYLIGGIFILWFAGWAVFGNHESALRVDKEKVTIEDVSQGIFHDYIRIMGNVEPLTFSQLTVQEGGNVKEILVEEGEMVKAGEVIIRLESKNLETEILNSKDRFAEEENSVQNSLLDLEREELNLQQERLTLELDVERKKRKYLQNKQLFEEDLIAKEEYLVAKEDYEYAIHNRELITEKQTKDSIRRHSQVIMLKQKMENARRNLRLTQERYARLNVCAPIDGQLSDLNVEIGQVVGAGSQIGKINVLNDYKVMTQIDEHYIDRVKQGLSATFERQGANFALSVRKVYPEVRDGKFRTDFVFTGERPDNIRSGQTYYISLELGKPTESIIIPRGTFFQSTGGSWIFVLDKDGKKAYRRKIKIGRQNPQYYEVIDGLEAGEKVIVSSYESYKDNEVLVLE